MSRLAKRSDYFLHLKLLDTSKVWRWLEYRGWETGRTGRAFGNPRVSRQAEQFVKQRTFFQFKRNSVLPAAASDNSYVYFFHFVPVNA